MSAHHYLTLLENETTGDGASLPTTEYLITLPSDLELSEKWPSLWSAILTCKLVIDFSRVCVTDYQAESRYLQ